MGGTGLATICDFAARAGALGQRFGYTEARIGFVPALVSAYLALQIGDKRARDLLLSARLFDAEEAYKLGIVNDCEVAPEALAERIRMLTGVPARQTALHRLAATKRLMAAQNKAWLDTAIAVAVEANAQTRETADFHEGIAAFLQKAKAGLGK